MGTVDEHGKAFNDDTDEIEDMLEQYEGDVGQELLDIEEIGKKNPEAEKERKKRKLRAHGFLSTNQKRRKKGMLEEVGLEVG